MDDPRHELARSALQQGRFKEAEKLYTDIVSDTPTDTEALYYLAAMQLRRDHPAAALQSIERAIDLAPKDARFHVARGQVLAQMEAPEKAQDAFELALSIEPTNGDAFTSLGTLLFDEGRYEEAEFALRKALIYHPGHRAAATQLGRTLLRLYRIEEAVSLFHAILQIDPNDANVQVNVGIGCTLLGDLASAREAFEAAIANDPNNIEAHVNYAHLLLLQGEFAKGYAEHEWRLRNPKYRDLAAFTGPLWEDQDISGKTVLLWAEQGLGDTLQFVRYAPLVAETAGRLIIECHPLLHRLVAGMPGVDQVVDIRQGRDYDLHAPLMSLPGRYGKKAASVSFPYLDAPPPADLGPGTGLRVGLVWAGNPGHARDRERSRLLSEFAPLTRCPNVAFYALQRGAATRQPPPDGMRLIDLASGFRDMADTAAAMRALDLVVSIDSAPAHLAGALGVPVWVLLTRIPDWRWGLGREDTVWYPSMRLFRDEAGWDDLFERVAAALQEFSPN